MPSKVACIVAAGCATSPSSPLTLTVRDDPAALTTAAADRLFVLHVETVEPPLRFDDLVISEPERAPFGGTARLACTIADVDGDQSLGPGDDIACAEPAAGYYGPADLGHTFTIDIDRREDDIYLREASLMWTPSN